MWFQALALMDVVSHPEREDRLAVHPGNLGTDSDVQERSHSIELYLAESIEIYKLIHMSSVYN